jgi:phenylalanyl-tRNA synthetase beta chain
VLERNIRAGAESVSIFEIGRVFTPPSGKEERHLGILLWGNAGPLNWRSRTRRSLDLFDLKGALECAVPNLLFRSETSADFALAVQVYSNEQLVGFGGQLSAGKSSATGSVIVAELNADVLLDSAGSGKNFRELARYPSITRDIAMIVPEKLTHAEILRVIREPSEPLLENVQLFDLFEMREGTAPFGSAKSLAYRLTYRAKNRTLTNDEVTAAHAKIRERLKRELGVTLRE